MTDPYSKAVEQSARSKPPQDQPPPPLVAPTGKVFLQDRERGIVTFRVMRTLFFFSPKRIGAKNHRMAERTKRGCCSSARRSNLYDRTLMESERCFAEQTLELVGEEQATQVAS